MTVTDPELPTDALESYLSEALETRVVDTDVLQDGLNLSVLVSTPKDDEAYVLRRPNSLRHLEMFLDVEREHRLLEKLEDTAVPTPAPVLFCSDESLIGAPFLVAEHLDGTPVPSGSALPTRLRNSRSRRRVADLLVDTLADIHTLDVDRFDGVCERRGPRRQVERAFDRLDAVRRVTGRELPILRSVGGWLVENAPENPATALVHGDFRPGNVLFAEAEPTDVTGVLDWETAMLGAPLAELGYLLVRWRDEGDPRPPLAALESRYDDPDALEALRTVHADGMAPFTTNAGSPSRRELVARYEHRTGLAFEHERFYRAHAAFLLAVVWADLHRHRVVSGQESDLEPYVDYMAMTAEMVVDGALPL